MTNPPIWPPPPNMPEPLSDHDEFLAACVRNSTPKTPLSRLSLVKNLREETGLDLRSCLGVVNNFCDRHAILMPLGGLGALALCLPPFVMFFTGVAAFVNSTILGHRHDVAATHLDQVAITAERMRLDFVFLSIYLTATCAFAILILLHAKKTRRQATEAREKFA